MVPDGRPCGCGQKGCLETYASANSVAARATEALQAAGTQVLVLNHIIISVYSELSQWLTCLSRGCMASAAEASTLRAVLAEKGAITAKDVFEAAERDQDTVACSIVDEVGLFLKHCTDCGTVWTWS